MNGVVRHEAPFSLRNQNNFFGGWPVVTDIPHTYAVAITFPVEGWQNSAAVVVSEQNGTLSTEVYGTKESEKAISQTLATLSLDVNDSGWQEVGKRDTVIANLQNKYGYLRPILFHSPYEAAAGFIIGQRISVKQRQAIQAKMADQLGQKIILNGAEYAAFPSPQVLLELSEFQGLSEVKVRRLKGIAQAALDGRLDRKKLLSMSVSDALESLQSYDGIGPFCASGILYRGAGIVDNITDDDLTKYAVKHAYGLDFRPSQKQVLEIAELWRPYRMWCEVLLHVWMRREVGVPKRH